MVNKTKLFLSENLQLRALIENRIALGGLVVSYVAVFIVYSILVWGRPDENYWEQYAEILGGEVNLTLCEKPRTDEFTRLPSNALSSIIPIYVSIIMLLLFVLDVRDRKHYAATVGNRPASILLRFPIWSLFIGLNFFFLGVSGYFFAASTMSLASTIYTVAQWSTILALCFCSVNRLIDPPVKILSKGRSFFGALLLAFFIGAHIVLTIFLVFRLDENVKQSERATETAGDEETSLATTLPVAVMYGLVVLGVFCAVVHWRAHSLTIEQQPALLFLAGLLAVIAAGLGSYDNDGGDLCAKTSMFQLGSFGFVILSIGGLITYFFFRGDEWNDHPSLRVVTEQRLSLSQLPMPTNEDIEGIAPPPNNGRNTNVRNTNGTSENVPEPEELGPPRQPGGGRRGQNATVRQIDYLIHAGSARIRRATTELASSRYVTPELGFTASQIRAGEITIGVVIIVFIVVVIYFSFG